MRTVSVTVTLEAGPHSADSCEATTVLGIVRRALISDVWVRDAFAGQLLGFVAVGSDDPDEPYRTVARLPESEVTR
jgi:hypothetical protein